MSVTWRIPISKCECQILSVLKSTKCTIMICSHSINAVKELSTNTPLSTPSKSFQINALLSYGPPCMFWIPCEYIQKRKCFFCNLPAFLFNFFSLQRCKHDLGYDNCFLSKTHFVPVSRNKYEQILLRRVFVIVIPRRATLGNCCLGKRTPLDRTRWPSHSAYLSQQWSTRCSEKFTSMTWSQ